MTDIDASSTPTKSGLLELICDETEVQFRERRRILSFQAYFELFSEFPERHARNAAQYVRDCFDHFGVTEVDAPWGKVRRFNLFDCPWDDGKHKLIGQESAQNAVYRLLSNFVQEGRIQRLVLLHGPNGSAKSSLVANILRALEAYSRTDEGALYSFNWIFPTEKISRGMIGFGGDDSAAISSGGLKTYAHLDELSVNAKIVSVMRDHPLLLLPHDARMQALENNPSRDKKNAPNISNYLRNGDLDHMSKKIFEALLTSYGGDFRQVLRHVQVERFFISRRYRVGAVTIEPQLRADAGSRQLTVDRSLQSLPASLQNQTLFEPFGALVEGNRGVVEYNDVLKRQFELNKYLLSTCEKATVSLEHSNLFLDSVLVGSANEMYLDAFKAAPDYPSFKARLELVRMPYILNYRSEAMIYKAQLSDTEIGKSVLPHTTEVMGLWAVLTRLNRPSGEGLDDDLRMVVEGLEPLEKAELYANGKTPSHLSPELARALTALIPELMDQGADSSKYEGRYGASPREMKQLLLNTAQREDYPHISPLAVFDELNELIRDPSIYPFLQIKPDEAYHQPEAFISQISEWYLDILDIEVREAMGLVEEAQYRDLFSKYITNVTHEVRNEKVYNKTTGQYQDADQALMQEVEQNLLIKGDVKTFRHDIMTTIAAWSIDNPGEALVYEVIFAPYMDALRSAYYDERQEVIVRAQKNLLLHLNEEPNTMTRAERVQVEVTLKGLSDKFGYSDAGAREIVAFLISQRYTS